MSERKVINKYYPPDFNPLEVQRKSKKKSKFNGDGTKSSALPTVRLMTPFSMRCLSCGEYMAKSKKFNAKKEDTSERYLKQKIFRFHIRCPNCNGEIVFRTDPKTSDFVMVLGGERNYNPSKEKSELKVESYDEILERLEKEEKEEKAEKEKLADKDQLQKLTKIQELEQKLLAQEDEEKAHEEISKLLARNSRTDNAEVGSEMVNKAKEEQDEQELDRIAKEEFLRLKSAVAQKEDQPPQQPLDSKPKQISVGLVSGYDSSSSEDEAQEVVKTIKISKKRPLMNLMNSDHRKKRTV